MASRVVYVHLVAAQYARDSRGKPISRDENHIKFGPKMMKGIVDKKTFYRAIQQLIELGFIRIVQKGDYQGNTNVYALSNQWER